MRLAALLLVSTPEVYSKASAQNPEPATEPENQVLETIVVEGKRIRGTSLSDIDPELVLNEEDIAAYGAGSLGELIGLISAEVSSNRGRSSGPPIVLINGRRVSGFREVGRYPVEALARVEVLPEEVSLSYGFSADQRVLNFVLKPNITVTTLTARLASPQQGGQLTSEGTGQSLKVNGNQRLSIDASVQSQDKILEADRDIILPASTAQADFRTVAPDTLNWNAGFSAGQEIWGDAIATVSGSYEVMRAEDLLGLAPIGARQLSQNQTTENIFAGLSIASALAPSTWTLTANFNQISIDTLTDLPVFDPSEQETALRRRTSAVDLVLNQRLADLSAGPLNLTASAGWRNEQQDTKLIIPNGQVEADLSRDTFSARLSINAPVSLPRPLPGDVTFNGNADIQYLSDFDVLVNFGAGATWRPMDQLRLISSFAREEGAPTLTDLGAPLIVTPNTRIFDFQSDADAFAQQISGGNPDLLADKRYIYKLGLQWTPTETPRIQLNVDYTRSRIENEVRTFRLLTDIFEATFPDRVLRDDAGILLAFDARPVQASLSRRDAIRTFLSFSKRLKAKRVRRRGPPPKKRRRSGRPGSLRLTAVHNWTLVDRVDIAEGVPGFDFLNGASGTGLGGTPQHIIDLGLNRWNNGLGLITTLRYQSPTRVTGPMGDLSFSGLVLSNLRATYEFNYNNSRPQITDMLDQTPLNFQDELLDPFGRTFRFEIRRRF